MATTQNLIANQTLNPATSHADGVFPPGTVAVKVSLLAHYAGPAGGALDMDATVYDSDDGAAWRVRGVSSCAGSKNAGQDMIVTGLRPQYRVEYRLGTKTLVETLAVTFYQPGDPIE